MVQSVQNTPQVAASPVLTLEAAVPQTIANVNKFCPRIHASKTTAQINTPQASKNAGLDHAANAPVILNMIQGSITLMRMSGD